MARGQRTYAYQSIPDIGPYGTATNRARDMGPNTGPAIGSLFNQGFIPSVNPTIPVYAGAPAAPEPAVSQSSLETCMLSGMSREACEQREAIASALAQQANTQQNLGSGPGNDGYADSVTPSPDTTAPTVAPEAVPQAVPDTPAPPPQNTPQAPPPTVSMPDIGTKANQDDEDQDAAEKGEPTAAQDAAALAANTQKGIDLGFMNPDGTPGKGVSTTAQTIGKDNSLMSQFNPAVMAPTNPNDPTNNPNSLTPSFAPATPSPTPAVPNNPAMTQAEFDAAVASAKADALVGDKTSPEGPYGPTPALGMFSGFTPSPPGVVGVAPAAPAAPAAPSAPDIGKGINEGLQSLTEYGKLDSVPTPMMDLTVFGIPATVPAIAPNPVNPNPPNTLDMTMEQALDSVFGTPNENQGWSFGKSSPQSVPDTPPSLADEGITAAPGETLGPTSGIGAIASFGDNLAAAMSAENAAAIADAAEADAASPSAQGITAAPGLALGPNSTPGEVSQFGDNLAAAIAANANQAAQDAADDAAADAGDE